MRRIVMLLTVATILVVMTAVTGSVAWAHVSTGGTSIDTGNSNHAHTGAQCNPWDPRGC